MASIVRVGCCQAAKDGASEHLAVGVAIVSRSDILGTTMSDVEHLATQVEVLEARLSRLAGTVKLLLEHLDSPETRELWDVLAEDFDTREME